MLYRSKVEKALTFCLVTLGRCELSLIQCPVTHNRLRQIKLMLAKNNLISCSLKYSARKHHHTPTHRVSSYVVTMQLEIWCRKTSSRYNLQCPVVCYGVASICCKKTSPCHNLQHFIVCNVLAKNMARKHHRPVTLYDKRKQYLILVVLSSYLKLRHSLPIWQVAYFSR